MTKITFHSFAQKSIFIQENAIAQSEIVEQGQGFIVLSESKTATQIDWNKNHCVYSVEVK